MRSQGPLHVEIELEVPFFDVDMMTVVWHGHYVKYLEQARCALLDKLNYGYLTMVEAGFAWPIVDMQLRYAKPARFGQKIRVRADLIEWENRLKLHYLISDASSGERLTRASTVQVAVDINSHEMQLVSPAAFVAAVEAALGHPAP